MSDKRLTDFVRELEALCTKHGAAIEPGAFGDVTVEWFDPKTTNIVASVTGDNIFFSDEPKKGGDHE